MTKSDIKAYISDSQYVPPPTRLTTMTGSRQPGSQPLVLGELVL